MKRAMLFAFLLLSGAMFAQTTVSVTLVVPVANGHCEPITSELINGTPFDLSPWVGMSVVLSPNGTDCSNFDGGVFINLPPQPFLPDYPAWLQLIPPRSQVTRGALYPVNGQPGYFESTDHFEYVHSYWFFTLKTDSWTGTIARLWKQQRVCNRYGCHYVDVEQSDVVNMTGTLN